MGSGIWTAVSGASAKAQAVDTVANNLANVDTTGFKKDHLNFQEYLTINETEQNTGLPRKFPIKDQDFYPLDGREQSFVAVTGSYSDLKSGGFQVTNSPLDLALDGTGLFEVGTPEGVRYTKQGSFHVSPEGWLVTSQGYPVLAQGARGPASAQPASAIQPGQGGPETQGRVGAERAIDPSVLPRRIQVGDVKEKLTVTEQGEIYDGENLLGKISVVEFADPRKLRKEGQVLFSNPDDTNKMGTLADSRVKQGMLERSNVNPVEEMTQLIRMNRSFEQDLKAMKTYGEMMEKQNDLGKL